MKLSKKKLIIASTVVVIVIGGIVAINVKGRSASAMGKNSKNTRVVKVHNVSRDSISSQISASGVVEAKEIKKVFSQTNGTIEEVLVEVGSVVKQGDTILKYKPNIKLGLERDLEKLKLQLDSDRLVLSDLTSQGGKQEILQAQASLAQLEKALQDAKDSIVTQEVSIEQIKREIGTLKKDADDQKELLNQGIISQKDYDDSVDKLKNAEDKLKTAMIQLETTKKAEETEKYQIENAQYALDVVYNKVTDKDKKQKIHTKKNEIESTKLQIEALEDDIKKADIEVKSPINGVISEVLVDEGANITTGVHMITVIDISCMKVEANINAFNLSQVNIDQDAMIKQDGVQIKEYKAKVTEIAPLAIQKQSGSSTNTVIPVTLEIQDTSTSLKPGLTVDVKIKTVDKENTIVVPMLAIMEDDEENKYVLVIKEDNELEKREVKELTIGSLNIEVEGIVEGEKIVLNPDETLTDGMMVITEEIGDN